MEHCIVYFSSSVRPLKEDDLLTILANSRRNNRVLRITGVLLYVHGRIIQVLEGERDTLETLYQRIKEDKRHTNVTRVLDRPIGERLFSNWEMGYQTITTRQLDDINATVHLDDSTPAVPATGNNIILKTIKLFYESNMYPL